MEIGNTALKAALVEGTTLGRIFRYQGERKVDYVISLVLKEHPEVLSVASSYELSPLEIKRLQNLCHKTVILDRERESIDSKYGIPSFLSSDRAASVIAVRHMFSGKSVTVMDFGTTLTIDTVGSDGNYEGGCISPGCRTRFKSLNRYAKALPMLGIPEERVISGNSIQTSVEAGVINGIVFEIQGYISSYPDNVFVFTGGDAIYFVKQMKKPIFVVCNLVLMGLAIITDEYVKEHFQ